MIFPVAGQVSAIRVKDGQVRRTWVMNTGGEALLRRVVQRQRYILNRVSFDSVDELSVDEQSSVDGDSAFVGGRVEGLSIGPGHVEKRRLNTSCELAQFISS